MSFLQKIEKMHIAAVRLFNVVMTLAVLVLGVVLVVYWVQAMEILTEKKQQKVFPPEIPVKIDPANVMGDVLAKSKGNTILPSDPNAATYERIRDTVIALEKSHHLPGDDPFDYNTYGPELVATLMNLSVDRKDMSAYLTGFADLLDVVAKNEGLLQQIHVASQSQGEGEGSVAAAEYYSVTMLITALAEDYQGKFDVAKDARDSVRWEPGVEREMRQEKAFGMLAIYGLPFALLILILQTFIFARIEQNIRPADEKNGDGSKARKVLESEKNIPTLNESDTPD